MTSTTAAIEIKPYALKELAAIYGITPRTMKNWITRHEAAIGDKVGRLYSNLQVKIIFEKLGLPGIAED